MIGTLNEGPLHRDLKAHYRARLEAQGMTVSEEVSVGPFVADLCAGSQLIEIQTGKFGALRRKLEVLDAGYELLVVFPVALRRFLLKLSVEGDGTYKRRRSPKRGTKLSLLDELVSVPELLSAPGVTLEVPLIEEETFRTHCPKARRGRGGWRTVERRLVAVHDTVQLHSPDSLWRWLEEVPDVPFGTAELASALGGTREQGRKFAYCLRRVGALKLVGKKGNQLLYEPSGALP